jgi:hypothetical protein
MSERKNEIIFVFITVFLSMMIFGNIDIQTQQALSSKANVATPSSPPQSSSNNNSHVLPVSMGTQVTVGKGNISATAIDHNTGRIYAIYYNTANNITNLYLTHSDDNGKTFSPPVRVNDIAGDAAADDSSPPVIKIGSNGDVYVSWIYSDYANKWMQRFAYGYATIRVAHSSDGGQTFGKAAHVDTEEYGTWAQYAHDIGISPDGKTVYVAWVNSNGAGKEPNFNDVIMIAKSTDGAKTFEKAVPVDGQHTACSCCKVNIAIGKDGSVYVSWRKLYQAPESQHIPPTDVDYAYRQIVVAKSIDGGQTFAAPVKVYDDKFLFNSCVMSGPQMAVDSKNNLHIVWYSGTNTTKFLPGSYYAVSSDGGKSFGKPIPLVVGKKLGVNVEYMALDGNDNSWIVWEDRSGQNNTMWMYNELPPTKIAVAKITPSGQMTKTVLDLGNGKLPGIITYGDKVSIVWNTNDHTVKFAPLAKA